MKIKYIITLLLSFFLLTPQIVRATNEQPDVTFPLEQREEISLSVKGSSVRIHNASGLKLEVFSLTGAKVAEYKIDTADKTVSLNVSRGLFVLKVGKITRKISIL